MAGHDKSAPSAPDPKPGRNPGYAEPHPRDRADAHKPKPAPRPAQPDESDLQRDPEEDGGAGR
ncbi:hypothetical protein FCE95_00255 [Luteimonas gilva]|uniref:Uncharacterized protein n=1 Tax=Luteimonas gilva TaxID=2572684 RepID=A0A4U5JSP3_9GAMM|nr:hypothetical protein [Luteimonas gilva]TKR32804.1 hypothetical protein FCE95_00255 [Luteimonas gilva]